MSAPRLVLCAVLICAVRAAAQEPAKFFEDNCAPCHGIGGPPGAAPDLKDVTKRRDRAWLVQFILDPEAFARADAAAAALIKQNEGTVMPATEGATPEFVESLLRYIEGRALEEPTPAPLGRAAGAADVAAGRNWYDGRTELSRRAPACASCHRLQSIGWLGGGGLGPDLTQSHRRLGGDAAVRKWLARPPTPVMRAVFRDPPLSADEALAITALLGDESTRASGAASARSAPFVACGAAVALAALASIGLAWSGRLRSVRRRMVAAARRDQP